MSADYSGSVEQVHAAFSDEHYWLARLADSGADDATLDSIRVGGAHGDDGSVEVITTQVLRVNRLPGVVTQFHRGDLHIRREENWGPVSGGTANATILGAVADAPVALSGTAILAPLPESGGARLKFRATVEVRIPLVGGKVENFVGNQLVELLIAEQRFTTVWIDQHT
jgi:hypothetical protein